MFNFLYKGLIRDRSRSFFPVIIITLIVTIIIFFSGFLNGVYNSLFLNTALVNSGHVKIVTFSYNEEHQLLPNDFALLDIDKKISELENSYDDYFWTPRITFAGLLDVPDDNGETESQSPTIGLGIDFLSNDSEQFKIWDLKNKLVSGRLINKSNEILISQELSNRLDLKENEIVTFIGSTMYGGFTTFNFIVSGIFDLNIGPIAKDMILVDLEGARIALDMDNAASEIFGYDKELLFDNDKTVELRNNFNLENQNNLDEFRPIMLALRDSNQMGTLVDFSDAIILIILTVFLIVVTLVLWNMGIMSGLRRYGEVGMRLAIGETKNHVFKSMILESIIIGTLGSFLEQF